MKFYILPLLVLIASTAGAASLEPDFTAFGKIPVQHEGRVKPLDTFARTHLLAFSAKESVGETSASFWLAELLFDPETAYARELFYLPGPDAQAALGLERRESHRYSFNEIFPHLREQESFLAALREKDKDSRTPAQNQLLELDVKAARFFEISRSLSLLLPVFRLDDPVLAKRLGFAPGENYSYSQLLRARDAIREEAKAGNGQAQDFVSRLEAIEGWAIPDVLRVFPPQFKAGALWNSPWRVVQDGEGSPTVASGLLGWRSLADAFRNKDWVAFGKESQSLQDASGEGLEKWVRAGALSVERYYNEWKLFQKAVSCYIAAFLLLLAGWMFWGQRLRQFAYGLMLLGLAMHGTGIAMRMFVMWRPPVSTLYESILFVAFIVVLSASVLEWLKGSGLGILIGSAAGSILLFISFGYAAEGDTMGVLVAVLNTNFWLATHVVCMTIGYGTCLVGGVLGHLYLAAAAAGRPKEKLEELFRSMVGVCGVALLFASVGTILGGIWADQSWGRFWGWDPKENGALLIVLWLLFLLHGRLSGVLRAPGFALGMVLTNVIVALAWFGVNLLNVGLHSYGFTENIALNLFLFCFGEIVFGLIAFHFAKIKFVIATLERSTYVAKALPDSD